MHVFCASYKQCDTHIVYTVKRSLRQEYLLADAGPFNQFKTVKSLAMDGRWDSAGLLRALEEPMESAEQKRSIRRYAHLSLYND